eukprot:g3220.t1
MRPNSIRADEQEECTPVIKRSRAARKTKNMSPAFVIEGNIGVGKSTLLNLCKEDSFFNEHFKIFVEPIDQWQNVGGKGKHNILEAFYKDPKGMAYTFQNFVFITRFLQHQKAAIEGCPRLLERSVWTDKFAFAAAVSETNLMTPLEFEVYKAWYEPVVEVLPNLIPDAFIYLRADPEVCFKRLKTRNREEESNVPLDYLQLLHRKHEAWFMDGSDPVEREEKTEEKKNTDLPSYVCGTHIRRIDGKRTHHLLDGIPVLVVDCNRHMEPQERTLLRSLVMKFVTGDLKRSMSDEAESAIKKTPEISRTIALDTTCSASEQGLASPTTDLEGSILDFQRRVKEASRGEDRHRTGVLKEAH